MRRIENAYKRFDVDSSHSDRICVHSLCSIDLGQPLTNVNDQDLLKSLEIVPDIMLYYLKCTNSRGLQNGCRPELS
jgi:hypothetical protein